MVAAAALAVCLSVNIDASVISEAGAVAAASVFVVLYMLKLKAMAGVAKKCDKPQASVYSYQCMYTSVAYGVGR